MIVRQACKDDLKQIADAHIKCFPDSFSTQLGKAGHGHLMQKFYEEYIDVVPELFLIAVEENTVIGFCMGYYCESNDYTKKFFLHNAIRIALRMLVLLLKGNRLAWKKVKDLFIKEPTPQIINKEFDGNRTDDGDLLSICVLEEYRGNGSAQRLIEAYLTKLKENNRKVCFLTVEVDNDRAISFYERNGFVVYSERVGIKRTYAKRV